MSNPWLPGCSGLDKPWFEPVGSKKQSPLKHWVAVPLREGLVNKQILTSQGNDTRWSKYTALYIQNVL